MTPARRALEARDVDGQAFFIGDAERVTWRDFYAPIAAALALELKVTNVPVAPLHTPSVRARAVDLVRHSALLHELQDRAPVLLRHPVTLQSGKRLREVPARWREGVSGPDARRFIAEIDDVTT